MDTIFPALIAGAVSGFVYGIVFRRNASTAGMDIIAKYVSKKDPLLNFFWINFALNAAIALLSYFVYTTPGEGGARPARLQARLPVYAVLPDVERGRQRDHQRLQVRL